MPIPRVCPPSAILVAALSAACTTEPEGTPDGPTDSTGADSTGADSTGANSTGADSTEPTSADSTGADSTGDAPPPDACPAPTGPGTDVATTLDADATWTADGSPYRISATTYLTATITLEPCTVVALAPAARLLVGNDPAPGGVVAHGEVVDDGEGGALRRPVRFERLDPGGAWGSIEVDVTGTLDAETADFVGGGSVDAGGILVGWGADPAGAPTPNLRLRDVTVVDAESSGIYLPNRGAFTPDSADVRITGTGATGFPIWVQAGAVGSLPADLEIVDNAEDVVLVETFTNVDGDTFPDRGVPLRIDDTLYLGTVESDGLSTLTIEAGVELQFATGGAGSGIIIGLDDTHLGQIVAAGTAQRPIVMRSAEATPAAGDWMGLYFRYSPTDGNVLDHVTITHAGASSGAQGFGCGPAENDASILLLTAQPLSPFLSDVTIADAGGDTQLLLGWLDASPSATAQAFADGNTFADSPACGVSLPRDTDNGCPGDEEPDCL